MYYRLYNQSLLFLKMRFGLLQSGVLAISLAAATCSGDADDAAKCHESSLRVGAEGTKSHLDSEIACLRPCKAPVTFITDVCALCKLKTEGAVPEAFQDCLKQTEPLNCGRTSIGASIPRCESPNNFRRLP